MAAPLELIATHTSLLKEFRIIGAYGSRSPAITKRPSSKGFVMSNIFGRTEEVFGAGYDKGGLKAEVLRMIDKGKTAPTPLPELPHPFTPAGCLSL